MRLAVRLAILTLIAGLTFVACSSTAGSGASAAPAASAALAKTVQIKGFAFSPATLTVDKGTVVTFTNNDSATHTVTSGANLTKDGKFDQQLSGGTEGTVTFDTVGTFEYFCVFHSFKGTVVVK